MSCFTDLGERCLEPNEDSACDWEEIPSLLKFEVLKVLRREEEDFEQLLRDFLFSPMYVFIRREFWRKESKH